MKKCRRCSKPATLHITEIREGKAAALHLCETCARDYLDSSDDDNVVDSQADLASKLEELVAEGSEELLSALVCPMCGITFAEFRETGRFGCPHDYDEFSAQLLPLLENIHEDTVHKGKHPNSAGAATSIQSRMIQLRKDLQTAVDCEDYESAARHRDEIAALELEMRPGRAEASPADDLRSSATPSQTTRPKRRRRGKADDTSDE